MRSDEAGEPLGAASGGRMPAKTLTQLVGQALPPELARLADGALGEALAKAIAYARRSVSPTTEKIYADDLGAFRA